MVSPPDQYLMMPAIKVLFWGAVWLQHQGAWEQWQNGHGGYRAWLEGVGGGGWGTPICTICGRSHDPIYHPLSNEKAPDSRISGLCPSSQLVIMISHQEMIGMLISSRMKWCNFVVSREDCLTKASQSKWNFVIKFQLSQYFTLIIFMLPFSLWTLYFIPSRATLNTTILKIHRISQIPASPMGTLRLIQMAGAYRTQHVLDWDV